MRRGLAALALLLLLAPAAGAATRADPGVTPTSILIGGTVPLSGEAAAFGAVGPGARAYFEYVNSKGGVHGRRIEYRYYDDAYNPAQTVQLTRRLVEQDRVLAIFNAVGTANNLAIRESTELGKDMTRGLSRAIAGKGPKIVASEPYELTSTDVVAQVAKLKASGADTLMLFATPKFMIPAR